MKLKNELQKAGKNKSAILAVEFYNYETLKGIMLAASRTDQQIILQVTRATISYLGLPNIVSITKNLLAQHAVTGWLHLDRGNSLFLIKDCLEAGFDSIMFETGDLNSSEYINQTREVVKMAKKYGALVEAELGYVEKMGNGGTYLQMTDAQNACDFVKETGVDALSIAVGNVRDKYRGIPRIDIKRLREIKNTTDTCLVLSGITGISDMVLVETVKNGICKVNIGDEIMKPFVDSIRKQITTADDRDIRVILSPAIEAVRSLVKAKLKVLSTV